MAVFYVTGSPSSAARTSAESFGSRGDFDSSMQLVIKNNKESPLLVPCVGLVLRCMWLDTDGQQSGGTKAF